MEAVLTRIRLRKLPPWWKWYVLRVLLALAFIVWILRYMGHDKWYLLIGDVSAVLYWSANIVLWLRYLARMDRTFRDQDVPIMLCALAGLAGALTCLVLFAGIGIAAALLDI